MNGSRILEVHWAIASAIGYMVLQGKVKPEEITVPDALRDDELSIGAIAQHLADNDLSSRPYFYARRMNPDSPLGLATRIVLHDVANTTFGRLDRESYEVWRGVTERLMA